jgi:hypothetical protein
MTKKVFIFIIVFIVSYEIYLLYSEPKIKIIKKNKINNNTTKTESNGNKPFSFIENTNIETSLPNNSEDLLNNDLIDNIDPNMFGKPSQYEKNNIIVWDIVDPEPWDKIVYNYNEKYPFNFYIKIKVPSLNDYNNWKNIIPNLDFNPRSGQIIIPSDDEETALSIANLIITNFKGDISLEDILNRNLIDISINKAKKYQVVKNKLIEQIMTNLNDKPKKKESFNNTSSFTTDLAKKQEDYSAYEGIEYSSF